MAKNLISVMKLYMDNNVLVKYYPYYFCVNNLIKRDIMLMGRVEHVLYKLPSTTEFGKPSFISNRTSIHVSNTNNFPLSARNNASLVDVTLWHERLGHHHFVVI